VSATAGQHARTAAGHPAPRRVVNLPGPIASHSYPPAHRPPLHPHPTILPTTSTSTTSTTSTSTSTTSTTTTLLPPTHPSQPTADTSAPVGCSVWPRRWR
jgi:hypothetical protein